MSDKNTRDLYPDRTTFQGNDTMNRSGGGIAAPDPMGSAYDRALAPPATLPEDFAADSSLAQRPSTSNEGSPSDTSSNGSSGAGAASTAKNWIEQHPLLAIGAGLIGGLVIGGRGGDDDHKHRSNSYQSHYSPAQSEGSSDASRSASGSGTVAAAGGIMGLAQQSGLMQTIQDAADQMMRTANDRAKSSLSEFVPGFDDQLKHRESERKQSTSPTPTTPSSAKVTGSGMTQKPATPPASN